MIKNNTKQLELVIENIKRVKDFSGKLAETQSTDKEVFWKALQSIIVKTRDSINEAIITILCRADEVSPEHTFAKVKLLAGQLAAYDEVLDIVNKNDAKQEEISAKIKELKEKQKEIENNIDLQ